MTALVGGHCGNAVSTAWESSCQWKPTWSVYRHVGLDPTVEWWCNVCLVNITSECIQHSAGEQAHSDLSTQLIVCPVISLPVISPWWTVVRWTNFQWNVTKLNPQLCSAVDDITTEKLFIVGTDRNHSGSWSAKGRYPSSAKVRWAQNQMEVSITHTPVLLAIFLWRRKPSCNSHWNFIDMLVHKTIIIIIIKNNNNDNNNSTLTLRLVTCSSQPLLNH